jgi:hypothetical protein
MNIYSLMESSGNSFTRHEGVGHTLQAMEKNHTLLVGVIRLALLGRAFPMMLRIKNGGKFPLRDSSSVPNMGGGHCLGPVGNGVSLGEGGMGGHGPRGGGKDKQSVLSEGRDNVGKDEEDRVSWT